MKRRHEMKNMALIDLLNRINDGMNDFRVPKCVIEAYLDKPYSCTKKSCHDCISEFLNKEVNENA